MIQLSMHAIISIMLRQLPRPIIFAHRGSSAYAPENTIVAFQTAIKQGAAGIELDAKLSADDQVVVIHDQTVDRTTPASGKVSEMTAEELSKLDAGSHFNPAFHEARIPTLEEVFATVGDQLLINIELTNYAAPNNDLPQRVAELVSQYKLQKSVLFSSFNPIALIRIRRLLPEIPIGLLAFPGWKGGLARSWIGRLLHYQALHPEYHDVTPHLVQEAHIQGNLVLTYTVNQPKDMQRLFGINIDGIFTDDPLRAFAVIRGEDIESHVPL